MSSNKEIRNELEQIYGKGSMFKKSAAEEYIMSLPKIKGIKQFIKEKHFTGKELKTLNEKMNYHHLKHVSENGSTTIENGAVVSELEHRYLHAQPRHHEEIINNHIRQWKVDFITLTTENVIDSGELQPSEEVIEIPVHTYHKKTNKKQAELRRRRQEKREFNRLRKEIEDR